MGKWANDAMMDAALDYVRANCDLMVLCSQQPTTYAEATSTYKLADVAMVVNTDYTLGNGDVSGRKIAVAAKTGVTVDTTGNGNHVALVKTGDSSLRYVTTCTEQAVTAGNPCDFPTFDIEVRDPA